MDKHWKALWIWGEGEPSPRNEWRCFRKTFAYEGTRDSPYRLASPQTRATFFCKRLPGRQGNDALLAEGADV